ncbi:transmembrane protein, putative [Bodo saltans]|uniref:Transmembrane protein, putative n=1 Tax=Bodo saltans TaxID=75058 RepID=A0A0S4JR15_BODSA|nr:transmembrane protein, putative [Bodo saltans]|eukprot:CUG92772.1 transmembrane protein, putative [Bodo saltans]
MFTSEDDKVPRMMSVLTEGMRVLREGGELCAYEDGNTSVRMWADLRDAGFSATVTDAQRTATPVMKKSTKMFHLVCPFSRPVVATEHVALHMTTDNAVSGDTIPKVDIGPTIRLVIVSTIQLILFVVLVLILLPLYKPLSIPTSIPFDTRLGNVVAAIIMGYPMFAHVSRAHFVASLHVICSVGDALSLSIKSELVTLGIASAFHAVNQLPGFLIQVAANGVSMSSSVASTLGVIVSFALGAAVVRYVEHMLRARLIASRNIPQEYAKLL